MKTLEALQPAEGHQHTTIAGENKFTIQALPDGSAPRLVAVTCTVVTMFAAGNSSINASTDAQFAMNGSSPPIIVNVTGLTTISFNSISAGTAMICNLANQ